LLHLFGLGGKEKGAYVWILPVLFLMRTMVPQTQPYIPAPGMAGHEDKCKAVYNSSAFHRPLNCIWNLCITYPREDILQYIDDIQAAFHRVLYHPDAMKIFASVVQEFLILLVGLIFG
jgi:hypothetical protein